MTLILSRPFSIPSQPLKARFFLAKSYRRLHRIKDAVECLREAVETDKSNASSLVTLSMALVEAEEYKQAYDISQSALDIAPQSPVCLCQRGLCLYYLDRGQEAIMVSTAGSSAVISLPRLLHLPQDFDAAISLADRKADPQYFYHRGNAKLGIGDATGAIKDFETAVKRSSTKWRLLAFTEAVGLGGPQSARGGVISGTGPEGKAQGNVKTAGKRKGAGEGDERKEGVGKEELKDGEGGEAGDEAAEDPQEEEEEEEEQEEDLEGLSPREGKAEHLHGHWYLCRCYEQRWPPVR